MEDRPKSKRGFASMTKEQRERIASLGGRSVPSQKRSFAQNRSLASEAGRKGGQRSQGRRRAAEGASGEEAAAD
jgi:general stress protein YciG